MAADYDEYHLPGRLSARDCRHKRRRWPFSFLPTAQTIGECTHPVSLIKLPLFATLHGLPTFPHCHDRVVGSDCPSGGCGYEKPRIPDGTRGLRNRQPAGLPLAAISCSCAWLILSPQPVQEPLLQRGLQSVPWLACSAFRTRQRRRTGYFALTVEMNRAKGVCSAASCRIKAQRPMRLPFVDLSVVVVAAGAACAVGCVLFFFLCVLFSLFH